MVRLWSGSRLATKLNFSFCVSRDQGSTKGCYFTNQAADKCADGYVEATDPTSLGFHKGAATLAPVNAESADEDTDDLDFPVVTLDGDEEYRLTPSNESYIDPGAFCFFDSDEQLDVETDATAVNLKVPGTYTVKYKCTSTTKGRASFPSPTVRTVIIDAEWDDYWTGFSQVQFAGYTVEKARSQGPQLIAAIAEAVDVPVDAVSIDKITTGAASTDYHGTTSMKLGEKETAAQAASVVIQFKIQVTQKALIQNVVSRMTDDKKKFLKLLAKDMQKNGLDDMQLEGETITFRKAVTTTAKATFAGAAVGIAFFVVFAAIKLKKMASSGGGGMDASSNTPYTDEERQNLCN